MSKTAERLLKNKEALIRLRESTYCTKKGESYYLQKVRALSAFLIAGYYHI